MKVEIKLKLVNDISELGKVENGQIIKRLGQMYFHLLSDGGLNIHSVTEKTEGKWIRDMINQKRIFIPKEKLFIENG